MDAYRVVRLAGLGPGFRPLQGRHGPRRRLDAVDLHYLDHVQRHPALPAAALQLYRKGPDAEAGVHDLPPDDDGAEPWGAGAAVAGVPARGKRKRESFFFRVSGFFFVFFFFFPLSSFSHPFNTNTKNNNNSTTTATSSMRPTRSTTRRGWARSSATRRRGTRRRARC